MKRPTLIFPLLATALAAPVVTTSAQDSGSPPAIAVIEVEQDGEGEFPWPDFIETDPLPGRYRTTFTIEDMSFPAFDGGKEEPAMADALQPEMEPDIDHICLAGPPDRSIWANEFGGDDCRTLETSVEGNEFNVVLRCEGGMGPGTMNARISGTAGEQGLDMRIVMQVPQGEMGKMRMSMRVQLERVGDCE